MKIESGLSTEVRQRLAEALGKLLADMYSVYLQTQGFHWNVTGKEFYGLHLMAEGQYQVLAEDIDIIAERIRALGFFVDASLDGFHQLTSIKDARKVHGPIEALAALLEGYEILIRHARSVGTLAGDDRDHATVDLLGKLLVSLEKITWMIRSHLQ